MPPLEGEGARERATRRALGGEEAERSARACGESLRGERRCGRRRSLVVQSDTRNGESAITKELGSAGEIVDGLLD